MSADPKLIENLEELYWYLLVRNNYRSMRVTTRDHCTSVRKDSGWTFVFIHDNDADAFAMQVLDPDECSKGVFDLKCNDIGELERIYKQLGC